MKIYALARLWAKAFVNIGVFALAVTASAQDVKLTPAKEVATNPQRFWARGFVFRDTLTASPGTSRVKIGDRITFPMSTKNVGNCFADESIAPVLRGLPLDQDYIFTGTVLSESKGLIRKRTVYKVIVEGLVKPAEPLDGLTTNVASALAVMPDGNPYALRLKLLQELVVRVQEALTVVGASEKIEREEFFDPESPHFEKLIMSARRAINNLEIETNVPAREHLAQILAALTAMAENRLQPPPAKEPISEATPVSDSLPEPIADEPVEEAPQLSPIDQTSDAEPTRIENQETEPPALQEANPEQKEKTSKAKRRSKAKSEQVADQKKAEPAPKPSLRWQIPIPADLKPTEPPAKSPAESPNEPSAESPTESPAESPVESQTAPLSALSEGPNEKTDEPLNDSTREEGLEAVGLETRVEADLSDKAVIPAAEVEEPAPAP